MRLMLSALAGAMLLGAAMSTPAEARCWWDGWSWVCASPHHDYHRPYYRSYYPHYRYSRSYYRHSSAAATRRDGHDRAR